MLTRLAMEEVRGWIHVRDLRIADASVGIYPRELRARQPISVDLSLFVTMTEAALREKIRGTIDYDGIANLIRETTRERHYPLIESLAHILAQRSLERFEAHEVRVEVHKPDALPDATASVELSLRAR
ncbi:MAG: dihydroneopterin aldolase [Myxococcota bacterium]